MYEIRFSGVPKQNVFVFAMGVNGRCMKLYIIHHPLKFEAAPLSQICTVTSAISRDTDH